MAVLSTYTDINRLRSYSSVFTRSVFTDIAAHDDFSRLDILIDRYGISKCVSTYLDFIKFMYRVIRKYYKNEYVFKNEFLTQLLIKQYGTRNTIAINEFKVTPSIVDIALFNGESKAFEIKTEYDTPRRLTGQLNNYSRLFDKCYIIIPEKLLNLYLQCLPAEVGIIISDDNFNSIRLYEHRIAAINESIDPLLVMKCTRTYEYQNIVLNHYGQLPSVSCFKMFDTCYNLIRQMPQETLRKLFKEEIKKRSTLTPHLRKVPFELRQIFLAMKFDMEQVITVTEKLRQNIKLL